MKEQLGSATPFFQKERCGSATPFFFGKKWEQIGILKKMGALKTHQISLTYEL